MQKSSFGCGVFFEPFDDIRTSIDSSSSYFSTSEQQDCKLQMFNPESWTREMMSVQERRGLFLRAMGFEEFISSGQSGFNLYSFEKSSSNSLPEHVELSRKLTESSGAALVSSLTTDIGQRFDSFCSIRDLDSGKVFVVLNDNDNGLPIILKEVGSDKVVTFQEFEKLLGIPSHVLKLMQREIAPLEEKRCEGFNPMTKARRWWRRLILKRTIIGTCLKVVFVRNSQISRSMRTKVLQHKNGCRERTSLFVKQEIRAHVGLIRTLKFSPSSWYLASGGEDCIVCIWLIREVTNSSVLENGFAKFDCTPKNSKALFETNCNTASQNLVSNKVFKILETPLQELHGHTGEILDISWSLSDCLLSSSMDKTVRLWKVGCDGCLKVFLHNDYVTCLQFNPADEGCFVSGSIDGKVRIWGVSENHVVDWVDIFDIVTAVCYRPDGKGIVVGSIDGHCRFYDYLGSSLQLYMQSHIGSKPKSAGKRITGLQFPPNETQKVMITSMDPKVHIVDGIGFVHKFRGRWKTRNHLSASFTSNGRHIISVGDDSNVYIWNTTTSSKPSSKGAKSIRSFQLLHSEAALVAVPWPNMDLQQPGSATDSHLPLSQHKNLGLSTCVSDSECCPKGSWLFVDRVSRVGPEEKLCLSPEALFFVGPGYLGNYQELNNHYQRVFSMDPLRNFGIVTGSADGFIRSFHHYQ